MAQLIPDVKGLMLQHENFSLGTKNAAGYHPGLVAPSAADTVPLGVTFSNTLNFD